MDGSENIVNATLQNFNEIVERSRQVPVLVEFYADEAPQSREMAVVLQRLAGKYQGKFLLARANIAETAPLVQQVGVRELPTLLLLKDGQMVQSLAGPQASEANVTRLLDELTMSPVERMRGRLRELVESGRRPEAIEVLRQLLQEEPGNQPMQAELADLLVMEGRVDDAQALLAQLGDDVEGVAKVRHRIKFAEQAKGLPSAKELAAQVAGAAAGSGDDLRLRFELAVVQVANDQMAEALAGLLGLMQQDRAFGDDLARRTMIEVFELLGKGHPLAGEFRRKMFNFLH